MSDLSIEKEIVDSLDYKKEAVGKLFIVELRKIHNSNSDETSLYRTSRTALYIEKTNMIIYPVIHFFKTRGIQKIYIINMENKSIIQRFIKEVGNCYLEYHEVIKIGQKLLDKYTLDRFYSNIQNIFSTWIKLITKESPPLIPEYESSTIRSKKDKQRKPDTEDDEEQGETTNMRTFFFGIHIDITKDERNISETDRYIERNIRKDFGSQIPRFKQDKPINPCPLI